MRATGARDGDERVERVVSVDDDDVEIFAARRRRGRRPGHGITRRGRHRGFRD